MKINKEYAEYKGRKAAQSAPEKKPVYTDDLSRLILFFLLFCAFVIGFVITQRQNDPKRLLLESVERTIWLPYTASIEGQTSVGDSVTAIYRSREIYSPGSSITELFSGGDSKPPYTSVELLESVRTVVRTKEMKREDKDGHPTRHFSGDFVKIPVGEKGGERVYFEFWADFRNQLAVRLTITMIRRNVTVNAEGDSLSQGTYLNIRFIQ